MKLLLLLLLLPIVASAQRIVTASSVAAVDSNLTTGGGTDDTAALQTVLDTAPTVGRLELIIDGVSLISGLNVRSNTTIRGISGGGFYLKNGSNRAVIRNQNRTAGAITDTSITLRDLGINGNRANQPKCADGSSPGANCVTGVGYNVGLQFFGVSNLQLRNLHIFQSKNISAHLSNVNHVRASNIWLEQPDYTMDNYGGIQVQGNSTNINLENVRCTRITDDCVALNAYDPAGVFGSVVSNGPITDVDVSGLYCDNCFFVMRIVGNDAATYVDRVTVRNVHGVVQDLVLRLASGAEYGGTGAGDIRRVLLDGVAVSTFQQVSQPAYGEAIRIESAVDQFTVRNFKQGRGWFSDYRPIIRIKESVNSTVWPPCGSGCPSGFGQVGNLHADLDIYDAAGTDSTGGGSLSNGYRVQVEGSIGRLFLRINHNRDASVTQLNGVVWMNANSTAKGIDELHLSGAVNRQYNTVALTGGKITRMFVNGFSDVDNESNFLQVVGTAVAGPTLRVSNLNLNAGALVGGAQVNAVTLAGVISGVGVTFANLGAPANSTQVYCTDCTATPVCAAGGSGAWAFRQAGAWKCQ